LSGLRGEREPAVGDGPRHRPVRRPQDLSPPSASHPHQPGPQTMSHTAPSSQRPPRHRAGTKPVHLPLLRRRLRRAHRTRDGAITGVRGDPGTRPTSAACAPRAPPCT
jgi:hypothetical protein